MRFSKSFTRRPGPALSIAAATACMALAPAAAQATTGGLGPTGKPGAGTKPYIYGGGHGNLNRRLAPWRWADGRQHRDEGTDARMPPPEPEPTPTKPTPSPTPAPTPTPAPLIENGFENGFAGWSMAGVGDVQPTIATDLARSGTKSGKVMVTGNQDRSELILGGSGDGSSSDIVWFSEGDERYYAFSFLVKSMQYGRPGAHNLITQLKSDGEGSPAFGLGLWDYQGKRGLWSHGEASGGDRYLAPIVHNQWNDVVIHFKASRTGQGFYETFLNGQLIDSRQNVNMIRPDRTNAYLKTGLYRNGGQIPGTSELRIDSARLGTTAAQVQLP